MQTDIVLIICPYTSMCGTISKISILLEMQFEHPQTEKEKK